MNKRTVRGLRLFGIGMLAAVVGLSGSLIASAQTAAQSLETMEATLNEDKQAGFDILAPKAYSEALKALEQAKVVYARKGDSPEFKSQFQTVSNGERAVKRIADLVQKTMPEVLTARGDAIRANAPEVSAKPFSEAVKGFDDLISRMEKGQLADVKKRAPAVVAQFRAVELETIKQVTVNVAKAKLAEAEKIRAKDYAPLTYTQSESLITATEKLLIQDRYAADDATAMAQKAEYLARLSMYLTGQARAAAQDKNARERQFLDNADDVSRLADELGIDARYDSGYADPVNAMLLSVKNLKRDNLTLSKEVAQRNQTIAQLEKAASDRSQEIGRLKQALAEKEQGYKAELSETKKQLDAQLSETKKQLEMERATAEKKRQSEAKIAGVEALFVASEATVAQEYGNVVIHLYGVSFKSGQSVIQPEYFGLLSKVQRAIREFPASKIAIEGHTDSQGFPELNQKLSEERSKVVRGYVIANMGLAPETVTASGYGATRPIANNDTPEGRAKNRRIDIVLTPIQEP